MITVEISTIRNSSKQVSNEPEPIESRLESGLLQPLSDVQKPHTLVRSNTASRLSLREFSRNTHDLVLIGEGSQNKVYFVKNKESGQVLSALKTSLNTEESVNLKKEIKLRRMINNRLLPGNIPYSSCVKRLLNTFHLTPDQLQEKLILNRATTKSYYALPNMQVASLPAVEQAQSLFEKANTLLTTDHNTQADLIKASLTGCRDVLVMLALLHACGIVHFDVKPENILINDKGEGYLVDYGYAEDILHRTVTDCKGSPEYASPEVIDSLAPKSDAVDVYSAGMSIALALLGEQRQIKPNTHLLDHDNMVRAPQMVPALIKALGNTGFDAIIDLLHGAGLSGGMLAHNPQHRPSAFEAALQLDTLCQSHSLNRPLSSKTYP